MALDGQGAEQVFLAPADCTSAGSLETLVRNVLMAMRRGQRLVTVDLSRVVRMNCLLLSAVIYLTRECGRSGASLRLTGLGDEFRAWAAIHGVLRTLQRRGVVAEPDAPECPEKQVASNSATA